MYGSSQCDNRQACLFPKSRIQYNYVKDGRTWEPGIKAHQGGRMGVVMEERKYALLIDAENTSSKYVDVIISAVKKYGIIT